MADYMLMALNILMGKGYLNVPAGTLVLTRGPGFPLLIAASYALFGVSVRSAFLVVQVFAVACIAITYLLAARLYSPKAGFLAAMFSATSITLHGALLHHIDTVTAAFLLASVFSMTVAYQNDRVKWHLLAGICLGSAYLVKEVSLLLLPMPALLAIVNRHYGRFDGRRFLLSYVTFALAVLPWVTYVVFTSGEFIPLLGPVGGPLIERVSVGGSESTSVIGMIRTLITLPYSFYAQFLHGRFVTAPLIVIAWVFALIETIRGRLNHLPMVILLGLLSPLLIVVVRGNLMTRQLVVFYLSSFIVLSAVMVRVALTILNKLIETVQSQVDDWHLSTSVRIVVVVLLLTAPAAGQVILEGGFINTVEHSTSADTLMGRSSSFSATGKFGDPEAQSAGAWLAENVHDNTTVLYFDKGFSREAQFYAKVIPDSARMPFILLTIHKPNQRILKGPRGSITVNDTASNHLLYLSSFRSYVYPRNNLIALTQEDLLARITDDGVDYVIIPKHRRFIAPFFKEHPAFDKVTTLATGTQIYKVVSNNRSPIDNPTSVTRCTADYLNSLEKSDPSSYQWYTEVALKEYLGLSRVEINNIQADTSGDGFALVKGCGAE